MIIGAAWGEDDSRGKTYEGHLCKVCGNTTRYIKVDSDRHKHGRCVMCRRASAKKTANTKSGKEIKRKYYQNNKEEIKIKKRQYRQKPETKIKINEYQNKRYREDPVFKMKAVLSKAVRYFCKSRGKTKSNKTQKLLGYSAEKFKKHIESLFKDGMTWDNYGKNGGWEIDHRIPQSYFTFVDQLKECFALENLKPEWGDWNRNKGNRFIG